MSRLWPLLVAVPVLALWLVDLSLTASSLSAQAEAQASAYGARAVDAVAVRVAARRAELQALAMRLSATPATWSTLEALRSGKAELAAERMGAVRRVAQDAVSTGLRNMLVLGLRTDTGGVYVRGAEAPGPGLQGVEVDVLAGAGSDGQTREAFGTYDLFFSVPLSGSDKDARALGTLVVGGPLLPDGTADQVALELGLAAVGFVTGGKLGSVGGPDRTVLAAALRETPVGKSAAAVRGGVGSFGPLRLPVWTSGPDPALRVALRRSLPGQPVEVLTLVSLEPFMNALADSQRFALGSLAVLALAATVATAWVARTRPPARRADEDTIPPPRRTTPPPRAIHRPPEPEPPPRPEPVAVPPEPLPPPPLFTPPPPPEPSPPPLSAAQLDELDSEPLPSPLPGRLPPPPPVQDLSALLDAMPPPPPPRTPPPTPGPLQRTPSGPVGGRFTPASRPAPPPPPLDYDHQPTTAYPIPDLPDFNAPPAAVLSAPGPMANAIPDTTRVADIPQELLQASARPETTPMPRARNPADEEHFQDVYREFVALRERCGESADGLTFERFAVKLRKNRDQLMAKYGCRTVRFQVYVKDGKAALKATPVRD
ncbi:MAG TPA: MXAN_5187 family protein [Myxococcaceae bacterium]|nr:MXAN_5187 family protein [Myxococcaceae bacterium]